MRYATATYFRRSIGLGVCHQLAAYGVRLTCGLLMAQVLAEVMDAQTNGVCPWVAGVLALLAASVVPLFLLRRAYERAMGRDGQRFREGLYRAILCRDLNVDSRGELEVKLRRDTQAVLDFWQQACPNAVGGVVVWVGSALLLCATHRRVGLLFFTLNLVQLLPIFVYERWTKQIHTQTCQAEEENTAWMLEGYQGAHVLKCYGAQTWYLNRFRSLENAVMRWGYRAEGAVTVENVVFKAIDSLLTYGSYVILGLFVVYGGLPVARLPLLVLLAGTLFSSVSSVFDWWLERAEYQAAFHRLGLGKMTGRTTQEVFSPGQALLACRGIEKTWEGRQILSGVSLDIHRGERVLLQGKNGSGKSTLLRILLGLEQPDGGSVTQTIDSAWISYALQEEAQTTLTVGELVAQLERVVDPAVLRCHLEQFQLLPCLDQPLSELSGGQQKRFFLAAALAKDSQLLILDEPTNHLDRDSVAYLTQVLDAHPGALLVCAHGAWPGLGWDRVIHMQGGVAHEG